MLLKRFLGGNRIEEELSLFFLVLRTGAVASRLRHVIAPLVVELGQLIELFLELLIGAGWRFLGCFGSGLGCHFFQDRIGFHLLLDEVAQLEQGRLQNEETLLQLRSKNLLERQALALMHPWSGHGGGTLA